MKRPIVSPAATDVSPKGEPGTGTDPSGKPSYRSIAPTPTFWRAKELLLQVLVCCHTRGAPPKWSAFPKWISGSMVAAAEDIEINNLPRCQRSVVGLHIQARPVMGNNRLGHRGHTAVVDAPNRPAIEKD